MSNPTNTTVDENEKEEIKSNAVVKCSAPKPATFVKLQCNTDLNMPPSNWLCSSADSYGLQRLIFHQTGFSSFRMAHMFPDCVGQVDVVSDAENIKKLLKIPYEKTHISMMIHRVENTLLIDDFDIYKYLLRTSKAEWEWLKNFLDEQVDRETYEIDRHMYIKNRTQAVLKQKSLVSKFLYHSLVHDEQNTDIKNTNEDFKLKTTEINSLQSPPLPDPSPNTQYPDAKSIEFNRNVVWTFENIEMLLGTDMPIFGGGTYPCISLRLRDMSKPISVLTGIDYWLDNLMSNVPELVMCYHINGFVQKYELIKTEDLPRLDNSQFSPKVIRDVAQSILSFLKSNATKAGHTYWLFKAKDKDVVKLYDLTSLCSEKDVQKGQNPFTIPVAMLLYRVARNMKNSPDRKSRPGTIRMLLKNVIKLLSEEKYPEIVSSTHYMLSDLYVPADIEIENPNFDQPEKDDDEGSVYDDDDDLEAGNYTATLNLEKPSEDTKFTNYYKPPPPLTGTLNERCFQAIEHIVAGLHCLQFFNDKSEDPQDMKSEEEVPMARSSEAIPMPYAKLNRESDKCTDETLATSKRGKKKEKKKKSQNTKKTKLALLSKDTNDTDKWTNFDPKSVSWKRHLKTLLFEKAALVYAALVEYYFNQSKYGDCLRVLTILARSQLALNRAKKSSGVHRTSYLLGRAGDACLMVVKNWINVEVYRAQLYCFQEMDLQLLKILEQDERANLVNLGDVDSKLVFVNDLRTNEQMLMLTVKCYTKAMELSYTDSMSLRLANAHNELGSYYLGMAECAKNPKDALDECKKSESHFNISLQMFQKLKYQANIALLNSNLGKLSRLIAFIHIPYPRGALTSVEMKYYNKALEHYDTALYTLEGRDALPDVWDAIKWELFSTRFMLARIIFDNPPNGTQYESAKNVSKALQYALDGCDLNKSHSNYNKYKDKVKILHFMLVSLWHKTALQLSGDTKRTCIHLAIKYYDDAERFFSDINDTFNFLEIKLLKIEFFQQLSQDGKILEYQVNQLQKCLSNFVDVQKILKFIIDKEVDIVEDNEFTGSVAGNVITTFYSLLKACKKLLEKVLYDLVKLFREKDARLQCKDDKQFQKIYKCYKNCFHAAILIKDDLECDKFLINLHDGLVAVNKYLHP